MTQVYVFDMTSGLVKIAKRGNKYNMYRLKEIQESYNLYSGKTKHKFVWESSPTESHNYKPYDEDDVSRNPDVYFESVKRWNSYKIRLMI